MADELKRTYNIPLRKKVYKKPKYKRAKTAIRVVKDFLEKHMKSENIKLGKHLNEEIWGKGMKNPPHHVKVDVIKDKEGLVTAELFGYEYVSNKVEEKKETFKDRLMDKVGGDQKTIVKKVDEEEGKKSEKTSSKKEEKKETKKKSSKGDSKKKESKKETKSKKSSKKKSSKSKNKKSSTKKKSK